MSTAAFNASGHLMKMQKLLESGKDEFEPSLEDYHLVLKAWAQNKLGYTSYLFIACFLFLHNVITMMKSDTLF